MPLGEAKADRARCRILPDRARPQKEPRDHSHRPRANSNFIPAPPRARPSPGREVFLENTFQLVPERREAPRQRRRWRPPPGQPLQGLIQRHPRQPRGRTPPDPAVGPSRPGISSKYAARIGPPAPPRSTCPRSGSPDRTWAVPTAAVSQSITMIRRSPVALRSMMFLPKNWPWITHRGPARSATRYVARSSRAHVGRASAPELRDWAESSRPARGSPR